MLPKPDSKGVYRYPDGALITPMKRNRGKWIAYYGDGSQVAHEDGTGMMFDSPQEVDEFWSDPDEPVILQFPR